jgi:peptide deformylase
MPTHALPNRWRRRRTHNIEFAPARRIRQLGDPVLRQVSTAVRNPDLAAAVLEDLRDTLHDFQKTHGFGRGISAAQIGIPERIIYMEVDGLSYNLINPVFEYVSEERFALWDDCFSFPDLLVWLERSENVCIRYIGQQGCEQVLAATGPLSELIQHEMDHLNGVLAIDRALDKNSVCTREEWERRYATDRRAASPRSIPIRD